MAQVIVYLVAIPRALEKNVSSAVLDGVFY